MTAKGKFLKYARKVKWWTIFRLNRFKYAGDERYCSVCERSCSQFVPHGIPPRPNAKCPMCGAFERHRLLLPFLRKNTNLFDGKPKRMLHVAPEPALRHIFANAAGSGYLTADLFDEDVMEKMDISDISHPDETFDVVFCSHVLEHVPTDRKAMREFYRVLKRGGWAILNVPVTVEETVEDPSVTSPEERLRLYGQEDHVRRYGKDYIDRLRESGFHVDAYDSPAVLTDAEIEKGCIGTGQDVIYHCIKK